MVNCLPRSQSDDLLVMNLSLPGVVHDVENLPRKNSFFHCQVCLWGHVVRRGVEATLLVIGGQPAAIEAVAEVLKCIRVRSLILTGWNKVSRLLVLVSLESTQIQFGLSLQYLS